MHLQVERQNVVVQRLPRSGAVVFVTRVYWTSLVKLRPAEARRLAAG
jgi:hypothetical protein